MDAARRKVDVAGEAAVASTSLGAAIDEALQKHKEQQKQQQQEPGAQPMSVDGDAGAGEPEPAAAARAEPAGEHAPGGEGPPAEAAAAPAAAAADEPAGVSGDMLHVLDWHWANLEYGCSARLHEVGHPGGRGAGLWLQRGCASCAL
jgi:hypothetical protein